MDTEKITKNIFVPWIGLHQLCVMEWFLQLTMITAIAPLIIHLIFFCVDLEQIIKKYHLFQTKAQPTLHQPYSPGPSTGKQSISSSFLWIFATSPTFWEKFFIPPVLKKNVSQMGWIEGGVIKQPEMSHLSKPTKNNRKLRYNLTFDKCLALFYQSNSWLSESPVVSRNPQMFQIHWQKLAPEYPLLFPDKPKNCFCRNMISL